MTVYSIPSIYPRQVIMYHNIKHTISTKGWVTIMEEIVSVIYIRIVTLGEFTYVFLYFTGIVIFYLHLALYVPC